MRDEIKRALEATGLENPNVESPTNESFGDYSSNAALIEAKKSGKKVEEVAKEIIKNLGSVKNIEKIEVVSSGFINFWVSKEYLSSFPKLNPIKKLDGKKLMVEFTDPNPFKLFHIGHLYSNTIGESLSRILEFNGAHLKRANYQGDVGLHVAKAIYGIQGAGGISKVEDKPLSERIKFLGQSYTEGDKAYELDAKKEIEELNIKIYKKDPSILEIYEKGKKWSLEYFEEIYKTLGTKFDFYYFESEVGNIGLELVGKNSKVFKESEGAVIFEGEKHGLHNRVFISSLGLPTYEAKELGLAVKKAEDFDFDESIVITGNEIVEYFRVVRAALSQIDPKLAQNSKHLTHGMVRTSLGKMSSRSGNIISFDELFAEVRLKLKERFKDLDEKALEQVALGSVKYAMLKGRVGKDLEFNLDSSISLEGDSGPYIQYTYVRTQSVLSKSQISNLKSQIITNYKLLNEEEISILRALNKFSEVVENTAEDLAPSLLTSYLFGLAQKFNLFYQKHRIEGSDFRLKLASEVGETIKNGLFLLGIEAPQKM